MECCIVSGSVAGSLGGGSKLRVFTHTCAASALSKAVTYRADFLGNYGEFRNLTTENAEQLNTSRYVQMTSPNRNYVSEG